MILLEIWCVCNAALKAMISRGFFTQVVTMYSLLQEVGAINGKEQVCLIKFLGHYPP